MPPHDGSVCRCARNDDDTGNVLRVPPKLSSCQFRNDPELPGQRDEEILKIRQSRLDLDDQENSLCRVPREDIDGPAVAEVVEAEFGRDFPTERLQCLDHAIDDRRVCSVE